MSDVFVNNEGIFTGKKNPNFSAVTKDDGTVVKNTFENPIIVLNQYDIAFDCESNIHDPMGWKRYKDDSQYTVYVPMVGNKMRHCSPTFIIVIKDDEVAIKSLETFSLTREILRDNLQEMFNSKMFGNKGSKNVFISHGDEKPAAIDVDRDSEFNLLEKLLDEFRMRLLVNGGEFDVIKPESKFDGRLGFYNGKWYEIEATDSRSWYRVLSEIEFPEGAKSVRRTVNYTNGSMKIVTLCYDGNFSAAIYEPTELLLS